ncbi:hypothetical protein [Lewinella sp. 4G2]|uniref:hypothetical protein n=1 Tax=Lewinella sp. 4G2 TaxID=1803372 RepID=UPI0007B4EF0B|nr:hypothetical protein [Lewinella sp. 4G2]OAV45331.1 hypothetical protein A3850_012880 [Lewinella sp. 4G2]
MFSITSCDNTPEPEFISVEPEFGSEEELIVLKGNNIGEIRELLFNGTPIAFNTAYNSDVALLFRVPVGTPLGETTVTVRTDGGSFTFPFLVSELPPGIQSFSPRSADPGDTLTILGENFFAPPLKVWFRTGEPPMDEMERRDSIEGEILFAAEDSMVVIVPEGVVSGFLVVQANGGNFESNVAFRTFTRRLITDFDGNGFIPTTTDLRLKGSTDQRAGTVALIKNSFPSPIDGNFLQLSGVKEAGGFVGSAESLITAESDSIGITSTVTNTFVEIDVNSNGRRDTWLGISFKELAGNPGDFTFAIRLNDPGWTTRQIPLVNFKNFNGNVVDPGKIVAYKVQLLDSDDTGARVEINVDNLKLVEQQ